MPYNILALDGGGRPMLMISMLEELERRCPGFLDNVDLFAGTSAGAVTAAFIAAGKTPRHGLQRAKEFWMTPQNFEVNMARALVALTGVVSFSSQDKFHAALTAQFGDMTLGDLNRPVLFTAVCVDNQSSVPESRRWTIRLIHTLDEDFPDNHMSVVNAVMSSGASPIVSPIYNGHVDGGLFANNPSMCALATARDYIGRPFPHMRVVSVGQGQLRHYIDCTKTSGYGYQQWLLNPSDPMALLKLVMDSNLQAITYECSRVLEDHFVRIDPVIKPERLSGSLDFSRQMLALKEEAKEVNYAPMVKQITAFGWFDADAADTPDRDPGTQEHPHR